MCAGGVGRGRSGRGAGASSSPPPSLPPSCRPAAGRKPEPGVVSAPRCSGRGRGRAGAGWGGLPLDARRTLPWGRSGPRSHARPGAALQLAGDGKSRVGASPLPTRDGTGRCTAVLPRLRAFRPGLPSPLPRRRRGPGSPVALASLTGQRPGSHFLLRRGRGGRRRWWRTDGRSGKPNRAWPRRRLRGNRAAALRCRGGEVRRGEGREGKTCGAPGLPPALLPSPLGAWFAGAVSGIYP